MLHRGEHGEGTAMTGERLGKWIIHKELGHGGMGRVYLAQEELTGRQAALKVLSAELAREAGFLHRFQREIETLSLLEHPNIVRFYEAGFENGLYFYAMEHVDGMNLEDVLEVADRLPWTEVLDIALQVCPALKHIHDHGVIHRDLKPANLLRTAGGVVKLTDFGIAKVFAQDHLTATGGIVGTADYLSPEQATGKPVSKRSDLYSLGAVLYTLLIGRPPFAGAGFVELLHKHRYGQFDPPRDILPELPYEIDEVVCNLLDKDPDKRPPDCGVLARQLESIRKKLQRKSNVTRAGVGKTVTDDKAPPIRVEEGPGAATLMSRLMRTELDRQNRGGPIARLFSRWFVVVPSFLLVLGILVWTFWPGGSEPESAGQVVDVGATVSEGQRLYLLGEKLRDEGNYVEARRHWQNVATVFGHVESEKEWARKAAQAAKDLDKALAQKQRLAPVEAALKRAAELRDEGKRDQAEAIWQGLLELYQHDPAAEKIREEIKQAREK
jgi:serine/threonine-protein kinase